MQNKILKFGKIFDILSALFLAAVFILTIVGVFQRYVAGTPIEWMEEMNGLLFIWAIMLGAAATQRTSEHLSINLVTALFPKTTRYYLAIFREALTIVICTSLGWYGYLLAQNVKFKITNVLGISYKYIDYAVPAGMGGVAFFSCVHVYKLITAQNKNEADR